MKTLALFGIAVGIAIIIVGIIQAIASIRFNRKVNKLKNSRDNINITTHRGKKQAKELNRQIDELYGIGKKN